MFFERPEQGERALLVHLVLTGSDQPEIGEFEELVRSAGAEVCGWMTARRARPDSATFLGSGKVAELAEKISAEQIDVAIFNHDLSPSQERNLEKQLKCRVLGRTGLILDIFAQRARTHEGKLQVELAQLNHLATRLVRGWTHLERQRGGIGLRGPGETQLETDRRLLRVRIRSITARLEKVRSQREQGRRARRRNETPVVSLVGYTNAGKSTLFNRVSDSDVYVRDQLFATLDPTMRRLEVASLGDVVLADTVGFIGHLPHQLVEAFRATLEEAAQSDLLIHVIDYSRPDWRDTVTEVDAVLEEIGADHQPRLLVYNKIDLVEGEAPRLERDEQGRPRALFVSAATGSGCELLLDALQELLVEDEVSGWCELEPAQGSLRARLYRLNAVESENLDDRGHSHLRVRLTRRDWERALRAEDAAGTALLQSAAQ